MTEQKECPIKFREMTCEEFAEAVNSPDHPPELDWMRDFAEVMCESPPPADS